MSLEYKMQLAIDENNVRIAQVLEFGYPLFPTEAYDSCLSQDVHIRIGVS